MLPGGVCAYGCKLVSIAGQGWLYAQGHRNRRMILWKPNGYLKYDVCRWLNHSLRFIHLSSQDSPGPRNHHLIEGFQLPLPGWVCTGRKWSFIVAAAFLLAAEAFFYLIEVEDVLSSGCNSLALAIHQPERFNMWGCLQIGEHANESHVWSFSFCKMRVTLNNPLDVVGFCAFKSLLCFQKPDWVHSASHGVTMSRGGTLSGHCCWHHCTANQGCGYLPENQQRTLPKNWVWKMRLRLNT